MHLVTRGAAMLALLLGALSGCSETPTDPAPPANQAFVISDGAHGGNPHVFFLPPMLPDPSASFSADFDGKADVTIAICVWSSSAGGCSTSIASFSRTSGSGSEQLRIPSGEEYFLVNWHTRGVLDQFPLGTHESYRLRVLVGSQELAFADVALIQPGRTRPGAGTSDVVTLVAGQTLPIKVRIEEGWDATAAVYPPVAGGGHTCRLTSAGAAWCWGQGNFGQLGNGAFYTSDPYGSPALVAVSGGHTFVSLVAGLLHSCGLTAAGAAWCWGYGEYGQLGDGTIYTGPPGGSATPVAVAGGHTFVALTASWFHTCGLTAAGAGYCWGANGAGALGDGTIDQTPPWLPNGTATPVAVAGGHAFSAIDAGWSHTCALTPAGEAWCWGYNGGGRLANTVDVGLWASTGTPVAAAAGLSFMSITAADFHTCAVATTGAAYCWGSSSVGQGGAGSSAPETPVPTPVVGGLIFSTIEAGISYTCGLTTVGAAWCWGDNFLYGQLGSGISSYFEPAPVAVAGGHTFSTLSVGGNHSCGLATDGIAYCWGSNGSGQLGDGTVLTQGPPWGVATPMAITVAPPGGW